MKCEQWDLTREKLRLFIKKRLLDLGRIPESQLRNYYHYYPPERVTAVIDELCEDGFCERIITPRRASIVVLRNEEELGRALQEDAEARVQQVNT